MDSPDSPDRRVLRLLNTAARPKLPEQTGLRPVMAQFATGITVLTAGGSHAHGMTANAFSSLSLDPPMVLCCVSRAARMHTAVLAAGSFAVSVLGADQQDAARHFADWRRPAGMAQFDAVRWRPGPATGAPLLDGSLAWLECALHRVHEGGDHSIFVGEVVSCGRGADADALVFFGGGYHRVNRPARASA